MHHVIWSFDRTAAWGDQNSAQWSPAGTDSLFSCSDVNFWYHSIRPMFLGPTQHPDLYSPIPHGSNANGRKLASLRRRRQKRRQKENYFLFESAIFYNSRQRLIRTVWMVKVSARIMGEGAQPATGTDARSKQNVVLIIDHNRQIIMTGAHLKHQSGVRRKKLNL